MDWQAVCEHHSLQNLPFKIELDENGKIIMSPVKVIHSLLQGEIEYLLRSLAKTGKTLPECAINTRKGTKVADVAWVSFERLTSIKNEVACSIAPEICVEVMSDSNTAGEMQEKKALYFAAGAVEFWLCDELGVMTFYSHQGECNHSNMFPDFPSKIQL